MFSFRILLSHSFRTYYSPFSNESFSSLPFSTLSFYLKNFCLKYSLTFVNKERIPIIAINRVTITLYYYPKKGTLFIGL